MRLARSIDNPGRNEFYVSGRDANEQKEIGYPGNNINGNDTLAVMCGGTLLRAQSAQVAASATCWAESPAH